jgi:hypothetical protein
MSAGIVFKSETHALMGYQPHKKMISGIGGKAIEGETPIRTAFRETVEELFGIQPTQWLLNALVGFFRHAKRTSNESYTMFILSLQDLVNFMIIVRGFARTSPYYPSFPISLNEFVLARCAPDTAEVTHLCLVPVIDQPFHVDQRDTKYLKTEK